MYACVRARVSGMGWREDVWVVEKRNEAGFDDDARRCKTQLKAGNHTGYLNDSREKGKGTGRSGRGESEESKLNKR